MFRSQNDKCPYLLDVGRPIWIAAEPPAMVQMERLGCQVESGVNWQAHKSLCDTQAGNVLFSPLIGEALNGPVAQTDRALDF